MQSTYGSTGTIDVPEYKYMLMHQTVVQYYW